MAKKKLASSATLEKLRGVARKFDYGDYVMLFRSAVAKALTVDKLIDGLLKAKVIGGAKRNVTKEVLAGRMKTPMGPWGLVVRLVGQPWTYLVGDHLEYKWPAKLASKLDLRAALFVADGMSGTLYAAAYEKAKLLAELSTGVPVTGKKLKGGKIAKELKDDSIVVRGPLLDNAWLAGQKTARGAWESVANEIEAFVPVIWSHSKEGFVAMESFSSRKLKSAEIERIDLVVFGPASTLDVTDPSNSLAKAIDAGDAAGVREALVAGADPDFLPDDDDSPLIRCLQLGLGGMYDSLYCRVTRKQQLEVLAALLEGGADLQSKVSDSAVGEVMENLERGDERTAIGLLELLFKHGADPNALCGGDFFGGSRPLYVAAMRGKVAVVKFLLASGADPKLPNRNGKTPLQQLAPKRKAQEPSGREEVASLRDAMIKMVGDEATSILDAFLDQPENPTPTSKGPTLRQAMIDEVDNKQSAEEQAIDLLTSAERGEAHIADWPELAEASYQAYAEKTRAFRLQRWQEDPNLVRLLDEQAGHTRYDTLDGNEPATLN